MIAILFLSTLLGILIIRTIYLTAVTTKLFAESSNFSRDYYVGNPSNSPFLYVALGDSTVQGTGSANLEGTLVYQIATKNAEQGFYVHVRNFGTSGARVHDVLEKQIPPMNELRPDLITVTVGANDATHFTSYTSYERDWKAIFPTLRAPQILIANTPNMAYTPALTFPMNRIINNRAVHQNSILNSIISSENLVDLYGQGTLNYFSASHFYAADLFHPSTAGYSQWTKLFQAPSSNRFRPSF